jgi:carboxymethylenebutenolidase
MKGRSRYLPGLLAIVLSWPAGRAYAEVREGVEHYRSGEATVTLEWFAPAARGKFPGVVLLHGSGGLDPGTAAVFRDFARDFADRGYAVMIPHYFERTGHVVGEPLKAEEFKAFFEAAADAVEFGVASGVVDPDRIGMIGYSIGAHIAFIRAARDPRIKAIVSVSGVLPDGSRTKFPPTLVLQGSNDRSNPVSRIKAFEEQLEANGVPHASHVYKGMGHNFDIPRWEDAARRAAAFFDRHLKGDSKGGKSRKAQGTRNRPDRAGKAKEGAAEKAAPKDGGQASPDRAPKAGDGDEPAGSPKPGQP